MARRNQGSGGGPAGQGVLAFGLFRAVTTALAPAGSPTNVEWQTFVGSAGVTQVHPSQMKFDLPGVFFMQATIRFVPSVPAVGHRLVRLVSDGVMVTQTMISSSTANTEWIHAACMVRNGANSTFQVHVESSGTDIIAENAFLTQLGVYRVAGL
jgi:hypothetical protein